MSSDVLFASVEYEKYNAGETLPARFERLIDRMDMGAVVKGKLTAIKMHFGRGIGYSTIHPIFVKSLISKLKQYGAIVYLTDQTTEGAMDRGYTEAYMGVPIVHACGVTGNYFYEKHVD